jgi:predicted permease
MNPPFWRRIPGNWNYLLRVFARRPEDDVDAELRFHFDERIAELTARGTSREKARAMAAEEFGDVGAVRDQLNDIDRRIVQRRRRVDWWETAGQDLRYALRGLRRSPGFTITVVVTLGVGIAANVTLAGAIDQLFFRAPAGVREPERVVRLLQFVPNAPAGTLPLGAANYPILLDLQREATAFESVAGFASRQVSLGVGVDAVDAHASLVSAEFFSLLGATPAVGRVFAQADGYPSGMSDGGPPLAVLSYSFWQRHYGRDPAITGRAVRIGALVYTIVGVMPEGFRGVEGDMPDVWLPFTVAAADPEMSITLSDPMRYSLAVIARLRRSVTVAAAGQQATVVWNRVAGQLPGNTPVQVVAASLILARGPDAPREVRVTLWLAGVSALVLLLACANVANLLLARAYFRRHEIAVRLALGAGRGRLTRQMLTEALLLAIVGGIVALCLTALGGPLLSRTLLGEEQPFLDARLFGVAAVISLGAGVLVGLAPVLQSFRGDPIDDLRTGRSSDARRASRVRHALLVTQSAVCMLLLVGAMLFSLSLARVASLDLGMEASHTVRAIVNLDNLVVSNDVIQATYDAMLASVRRIPGVMGAALASSDPFSAGRAVSAHTATHDGDYFWPRGVPQVAIEAAVGDGFFSAVGASTLRGRDFNGTDTRGAPPVAIINAPLARILYRDQDPLGQCVVLPVRTTDHSNMCVTVVGVLPGVFYSNLTNRNKPVAYVPLAQRTGYDGVWRPRGIFIRVRGEPGIVVEEIRRTLQGVRSDLPAVSVTLMRDVVAAETRPWRLGAIVFGLYGGVALIVAVIGLYGVVSFAVAQRSMEIAVRLALGARRRDIFRAVSVDGLGAVVLGLCIGAGGALAVQHWVGPLLFQTTAADPRIILGIASLLFGVGWVAALIPTARALRLDAVKLLRKD